MKHDLLVWPIYVSIVVALVAAPPASGSAAVGTKPHPPIKDKAPAKAHGAPADEYFGHQKLSILGVRNTVHDLNIRYDGSVQRSGMVISVGSNLEDAMITWSKRYPGDLWLAHNAFQLVQIYMRVPTPEGRARLKTLTDWIIQTYPHTYYGRYLTQIRALALAKENASPTPVSLKSGDITSPVPGSPKPVPGSPNPMPGTPKPISSAIIAIPATKTADPNRTPPPKDSFPI